MSPVAILLFAIAGDMPPADAAPPKVEVEVEIPIQCNDRACIMPRALVKDMLDAHNIHVQTIRDLEKRLAVVSEAKGCGKVEVVPKLPNFKKERDL